MQIDIGYRYLRENAGEVVDMPATIEGSEGLLEVLDLEPVTKYQGKLASVKPEVGCYTITKVPQSEEYRRAINTIMSCAMEELADFPTWQAKFKRIMMSNFGAENGNEQDTSGSWDAIGKPGIDGEFRAEDYGVDDLHFLPEPQAREGSASASAVRRTSPAVKVRRPRFSKNR